MRILEWKNKQITEADLFVELDEDDIKRLGPLFPELKNACDDRMGYHVFVDTAKKTIIPMSHCSYAFGPQYNGYPPYGNVLNDIGIDFSELTWYPYAECEDAAKNTQD